MRPIPPVLCVIVVSCTVDLGVHEGAVIQCGADAECPEGWFCTAALCVPGGATLEVPELSVAFTSPRDGAEQVSVLPDVVLAFSFAVDPSSLDERVTLTAGLGGTVSLTRLDTDVGNTFQFTPDAPLKPLTEYELRVHAGVRPTLGVRVESLSGDFVALFQTAAAPDMEPPAPVEGLVVDRREDRVVLQWINPDGPEHSDPADDFAGVLIVRKAGSLASATPEDGRVYSAGAPLGSDGSTVIATTAESTFTDLTASSASHDYVVFAFDEAANYAEGRRAPLVQSAQLQWCTDETASFQATALEGTAAYVSLTPEDAQSTSVLFPTDGTPLGTQVTIPVGSVVEVGSRYIARIVVVGPQGEVWSAPQLYWASSSTLPITQQPMPVAPGGESSFAFDPLGWESFAAEVDTNPVAASETYSSEGVSITGTTVSAVLSALGEYRFRVRPVVAGCPPAPWTVSDAVLTGDFLYVDDDATGTGSGADPANAMTSIGDAVSAATTGTTIFVAEGTYAEQVTLKNSVRLWGSFDAAFRSQDVESTPSRITFTDTAVLASVPLSEQTELRAFDIESEEGYGVSITQGNPSIADNIIRGTQAALLVQNVNTDPHLAGNVLEGTGTSTSYGLYVSSEAEPDVFANTITGGTGTTKSVGIYIDGAGGRYDANIIVGRTSGLDGDAFGIETLNTSLALVLISNIVDGGTGNVTTGVDGSSMRLRLVNNTIDGGQGVSSATAAAVSQGVLANNILFTSATTGTRRCIQADTQLYVWNNAVFDCPGAYLDFFGTAYQSVNAQGQFTDGCCSTPMVASNWNNVIIANRAAMAFAAADDLRLTASSPESVRHGGLDAGNPDGCPMLDPDPVADLACGNVFQDFDGMPRSCPAEGSDCFSMGAFEWTP